MRLACPGHDVFLIGLLLVALVPLAAQNPSKSDTEKEGEPAAASKSGKTLEDTIPVSLVTFSEAKVVPSAISSPSIFVPVGCVPDGTVLVTQPVPPAFLARRITAASLSKPGDTVTIDSGSVPGLTSVQFMHSFASESEIAVLAGGLKVEGAVSQAGHDAELHQFILVYDRKGSFQKAILLDIGFDASRFGVLKSGNFVITGFDRVRRLPRVAIVGSGGDLLRFVDLKLDNDFQVRGIAPGGEAEAANSSNPFFADQDLADFASSQQFVPYGGNLLLVSPGANFPVFEIGDGGILRSTAVKLPKDARIDSFIPSDTRRWIVKMTRQSAKNARPEGLLYEVDPDTGELLRSFEGKDKLPMIACAVQNSFVSFRIDKPGTTAQLMMMTGTF